MSHPVEGWWGTVVGWRGEWLVDEWGLRHVYLRHLRLQSPAPAIVYDHRLQNNLQPSLNQLISYCLKSTHNLIVNQIFDPF